MSACRRRCRREVVVRRSARAGSSRERLKNRSAPRALQREERDLSLMSSSSRVELGAASVMCAKSLSSIRRVDDHHDVVRIAVDEAIVFDGAAIVEDSRVVHLVDLERGDVVGRHVVHEVHRLRPADQELAHVADVEQPALLRTALCSAVMPVGYWTGISKPANGTILAPNAMWTSVSGVRTTRPRGVR